MNSLRRWISPLRAAALPLFFVLLNGVVENTLAQGIILPRPCNDVAVRCAPPEWQRPLKVKSIRLTTTITDQAAVTKIEQIFVNESPLTLEGTYFFPLPDTVSIGEFAMWDGDKRLQAEFRSRDEARRIYDSIMRSRRDPALLEYAGKNLFQASIFPIAPRSEKKIELAYSQLLASEAGTVSYRYPLGTGWRANGFAPVPRNPRAGVVPLAEPAIPPPGRPAATADSIVSGVIEINSRTALKGIYSPSHELEIKRDGERKARITFEQRGVTTQPDLQLYYTLSDQDFGLSLLTHREPGKDGYFMLLVAPKAELEKNHTAAKEVIFVVDTSGSMADEGKLGKAKAALRFGVNTLNARDRFNIVSFAGEEHLFSEHPREADDTSKAAAREFIDQLKATGGTNINDALQAALKQLTASAANDNKLTPMIVLLTDGQPTVGVTQASKIIGNATEANKTKARLFTFGVGYDVNTVLLDALANDNRGAVAYIEPKEDLEVKVSSFFAKVNNPVLSDVEIDWGGVETELVYPRTAPDLFHGAQLVLVGRYRPGGKKVAQHSGWTGTPATFFGNQALLFAMPPMATALATAISNHRVLSQSLTAGAATETMALSSARDVRITLTGKVNGRERKFTYDQLQFPETQRDNDFLPQLWAMRRVGFLLDQIKLNGEAKELREEVIALGTRYGIVTPYTSALVLEPGMRLAEIETSGSGVVVTGQQLHTLPRFAPGAADAAKVVAPSARATATAGQVAVQQSISNQTLRKAENVQLQNAGQIGVRQQAMNQIANKTFYQVGNSWNDSEYKPDAKLPEVKVKFGSDAYYQLLKDEPKLAQFLAQGQNVIVVWNNKAYQVTE